MDLKPFQEGDDRFLVQDTINFCKENNPLFLERPSWLRTATCVSAFLLPIGYCFVLFASWVDRWSSVYICVPCLLFVGFKCNAIYFYHLMEFTSHTPPPNLVPYFAAEGPYILSLVMVLTKCFEGLSFAMDSEAMVRKGVRNAFVSAVAAKKLKKLKGEVASDAELQEISQLATRNIDELLDDMDPTLATEALKQVYGAIEKGARKPKAE